MVKVWWFAVKLYVPTLTWKVNIFLPMSKIKGGGDLSIFRVHTLSSLYMKLISHVLEPTRWERHWELEWNTSTPMWDGAQRLEPGYTKSRLWIKEEHIDRHDLITAPNSNLPQQNLTSTVEEHLPDYKSERKTFLYSKFHRLSRATTAVKIDHGW